MAHRRDRELATTRKFQGDTSFMQAIQAVAAKWHLGQELASVGLEEDEDDDEEEEEKASTGLSSPEEDDPTSSLNRTKAVRFVAISRR